MAIKFGNEENAKLFFEAFEEMKKYVLKIEAKRVLKGEEVSKKTTVTSTSSLNDMLGRGGGSSVV